MAFIRRSALAACAAIPLASTTAAHAALIDRGGGLIYDSVRGVTCDERPGLQLPLAAQAAHQKILGYAAWAVRDGDVGEIPATGSEWLLGTGLLGLAGRAQRRMRH